ncbi:MATH and LRR domain-containing protein PFE0570w isoform X2 [Amyelois transitella]|uniref:MATH and LRR domain-containing protein PFE0570w isoform X2 n=1 Tax=Amyelois transitella TaxID=680683 RepID=UPI00298FC964|nr:MATH and LRR domain-containing protein PFE0570w isoform X2 [Amyelois transitella]
MRLTGSRTYVRPTPAPKMPTGLVELMEDLTRDVLKNNPTDVYEFCAGHMHKLLEIRDGPSLKRPLTLEEKIARAQEKVKKRGEARWKKYLKEKKIKTNPPLQPAHENKARTEETKIKSASPKSILKPPIYPDLNTDKTPEIEISHEPGDVSSNNVEVSEKVHTNNIVENKERVDDTEKTGILDMSQTIDKTCIDKRDKIHDNENEELNQQLSDTETTGDSVMQTSINDTQIMELDGKLHNSKNDEQSDEENNTDPNKHTFTNNTFITDNTIKNVDNGEVFKDEKNTRDPIPIETGHDTQIEELEDYLHNIGNVDNKNLINDTEKTGNPAIPKFAHDIQNFKVENKTNGFESRHNFNHPEKVVDPDNSKSIEDINNDMLDANKIQVVKLSDIVHDNSSVKDTEKLEEQNESKIPIEEIEIKLDVTKNGFADIPNILYINDKHVNKEDDENSNQEITAELEIDSEKSKQEIECHTSNSIADMGRLVNTAIGVLNTINESPSQNAATEDLNDTGRKYDFIDEEKENLLMKVPYYSEIKDTNNKSAIKLDADSKHEKSKYDQTESSMIDNSVENLQQAPVFEHSDIEETKCEYIIKKEKRSVTTVLPVEEGNNQIVGNNGPVNISDKILKDDLEIPILRDTKLINENIYETGLSVKKDHELTNQSDNLSHDKGNKSNCLWDGNTRDPSVDVVDIFEINNDLEETNEGNIIEIRISQVAEALNNEVPLTHTTNLETFESESPSISLLYVANNQADIDKKMPQTHTLSNDKDTDFIISNIMLTNVDDINTADFSGGTKSMSIDESTDGFDNTSLIESGSSDVTDDAFINNLNNHDMDLETAAVTIQKVFRSFLFKSRASTFDDNDENISLDEDNQKKVELEFQTNINKERRGISRMDTVLQTVNEEKSLSLSTDDSSTLSSAATTIQAHVRGFLVRNKLHSNKTASTNSLANSDGHDDGDIDSKNKTVLNIHIVPEGEVFLSRDESMVTSMDLSLDGSPPSSLNLHPLGYDKNERRKLKREDAIQSISPPSNNSGKLSEDMDSVKDMLITEREQHENDKSKNDNMHNRPGSGDKSPTNSLNIVTVIEAHKLVDQESSEVDTVAPSKTTKPSLIKQNSDEMDVVTPFEDSLSDSRSTSKLLHSSEFHDIVLPTKVSRSDATVVSGE